MEPSPIITRGRSGHESNVSRISRRCFRFPASHFLVISSTLRRAPALHNPARLLVFDDAFPRDVAITSTEMGFYK